MKTHLPTFECLIVLLLFCQGLNAQSEFFDDFNYTNPDDTLIENFGWIVLDGPNWPGQNGPVPYLKENVDFIDNAAVAGDRVLTLSTQTTNLLDDRSFSRVEYSEYIFLDGLYAARVHFDNTPATYQDGNVETFYTIFNAPSGDPDHAECDFEYLPYNIWGGGNVTNTLYATTWESYILSPWQPTNASTEVQDDFSDDWKLLLFTVLNDTVTYYVDGELFATHVVADQDASISVYPDNPMQISLANWIWSNNALPLGPSPDWRTATMLVDWVYHLKDATLTQEEVLTKIDNFRTSEIHRKNTMDGMSSGIFEQEEKLPFQIYPNPGLGEYLTLQTVAENITEFDLEIKNIEGNSVFQKTYKAPQNRELTVMLSDLPKGVYFVIISAEGKQQVTKWMIH